MALTSCSSTPTNTAKTYKVGSFAVTEGKFTEGEGDAANKAQMNTTLATVVLDADGKIVEVNLDVAQNSAEVAKDGKATLPTETPTKKEKGDAYGMKKASPIGKEWYEQAQALEQYLVGKTLEEVKGFAVTDDGYVSDEDLKASVSVTVTGYLEAVTRAMEVAKEVTGEVAKVGQSSITHVEDRAATADEEGRLTFNTYFGHVVLDKDGKVLQAYIDTAQNRVNYGADGKFGEFTPLESKQIRGDEYGMKKASGIGKEWNEQATALAEYMVGKTAAEIEGIAVDADGVVTDADLKASVTVGVTDYIELIKKAIENAVEIK